MLTWKTKEAIILNHSGSFRLERTVAGKEHPGGSLAWLTKVWFSLILNYSIKSNTTLLSRYLCYSLQPLSSGHFIPFHEVSRGSLQRASRPHDSLQHSNASRNKLSAPRTLPLDIPHSSYSLPLTLTFSDMPDSTCLKWMLSHLSVLIHRLFSISSLDCLLLIPQDSIHTNNLGN